MGPMWQGPISGGKVLEVEIIGIGIGIGLSEKMVDPVMF